MVIEKMKLKNLVEKHGGQSRVWSAQHGKRTKCKDSVVESGVCGCVSEFDIAGTGAVYIKAYGGTLCFFLPDARAHDQSRRQKTALLQAEIRKAVKRSVLAGSSFEPPLGH